MKLLIGILGILFSINAFCEMNWNKVEFGYLGETAVLSGEYTDDVKELLEAADEDTDPLVVTSAMAQIPTLKYSLMFDWLHFEFEGRTTSYSFTDADSLMSKTKNSVNVTHLRGGIMLSTGLKSTIYGFWNVKDEVFFDYDPVGTEIVIKKETLGFPEVVLEQIIIGDKGNEFGFRLCGELEANGEIIRQRTAYAFDLYINFENADHKFKFLVGGRGISKKTRNAEGEDPVVDTEFNFNQRDVYAGLMYGIKF